MARRNLVSAQGGAGMIWLVLVGLTVLSWPLCGRPVAQWVASATWIESRCEIVAGEWVSGNGARLRDRRASYSLQFRYDVDGQSYASSAINLTQLDGNSGIRSGGDDARWASRYRVGSVHACWRDPVAPQRAVLERTVTALPWILAGVLLILLMAASLASIPRGSARRRRRAP